MRIHTTNACTSISDWCTLLSICPSSQRHKGWQAAPLSNFNRVALYTAMPVLARNPGTIFLARAGASTYLVQSWLGLGFSYSFFASNARSYKWYSVITHNAYKKISNFWIRGFCYNIHFIKSVFWFFFFSVPVYLLDWYIMFNCFYYLHSRYFP